MPEKSKMLEVSLSVDEKVIAPQLIKALNKLGIDLPKTAKGMTELITLLTKEIFENMSSHMELNLEWHMETKLSAGTMTRERKIMDKDLRSEEFTILPPTQMWLEKNFPSLFQKYEQRNRKDDNGNKMEHEDFRKELSSIVRQTHPSRIMLSCTRLLNNCYPIELMKDIGIEKSELRNYALTITQVEKLLKRKGIHKKWEQLEKGKFKKQYPPACIFVVRRYKEEIRFLKVMFSEYWYDWDYVTTPPEGGRSVLPKDSKLFLAFPVEEEITQ